MRTTTFFHALIVTAGCAASAPSRTAVQPLPSASTIDAPCDPAKEAYACSSDGMRLMMCDARRWRVAETCGGAGHCTSTASKIKCDDTLSADGAPCTSSGDMACSTDGSALLRCTNGAMVRASACRGEKACAVVAGLPTCDRTSAEPGDACDTEGEAACTVKGDAIVECRNKTMVQTTVCTCRVNANAAGTSVRCL